VISLGGIVVSDSLRIAGDDMDVDIKDYIKNKYKMEIGMVTAEKIKMTIGNASTKFYSIARYSDDEDQDGENIKPHPQEMQIRGRDIVSGLPLNITVTSDEIREAIIETVNNIVNAIKRVLEKTPPELSSDIYSNGIYLSGGGALLKGLDIYIEKETGLKVFIAENPLNSVAMGAGKICESL